MTSTVAGNITLAGTVNDSVSGTVGLIVNTAGTTTFGGVIGGIAPLASITTVLDVPGATDINAASITTTGTQTYNDPVTLGLSSGNLTLTSSGVGTAGNITLGGTVDDSATSTTSGLVINTAGITTFLGAVGSTTPLASVTTDAAGSTDLNGSTVQTSGGQTYNDIVLLSANTTLTSTTTSNIVLNNTVDGAYRLIINTAGTTIINGVVGGNAPLASLTSNGPGAADLNGGEVLTTGAQTYNDAVVLGSDTILLSTQLGAVSLNGVTGAGDNLSIYTAGATTFNGNVSVASLFTDSPGTTSINTASITTAGNQTYGDPVTIKAAAATLASTGAGNINFNKTVNGSTSGANTLVVNTAGNTLFNGLVGSGTPLASITTDAPGSTTINGGSVTTTGNQLFQDRVLLGQNTTLTASSGGANITAGSSVDSASSTANSLTINASGLTTLGTIGAVNALSSVTTDSAGTTQLNGSTLGGGTQNYQDTTVTVASGGNLTGSLTLGSGSNPLNVLSGGTVAPVRAHSDLDQR